MKGIVECIDCRRKDGSIIDARGKTSNSAFYQLAFPSWICYDSGIWKEERDGNSARCSSNPERGRFTQNNGGGLKEQDGEN